MNSLPEQPATFCVLSNTPVFALTIGYKGGIIHACEHREEVAQP
jgi:hypothetical protein